MTERKNEGILVKIVRAVRDGEIKAKNFVLQYNSANDAEKAVYDQALESLKEINPGFYNAAMRGIRRDSHP